MDEEPKKEWIRPWWLILIAGILYGVWTLATFLGGSNWRRGFLFLISGLIGFVLKYGPFGFTCSFRSMLSSGNFTQMRDMFFMIIVSTFFINIFQIKNWVKHPLFFPEKDTFGLAHTPIGASLAIGSFFFGIGMQLGSGCATGTLVGMGEGAVKSWIVIWFFIIGATVGATNSCYNWWSNLPQIEVAAIHWGYIILILVVLLLMTYLFDYVHFKINTKNQQNINHAELLMSLDSPDDETSKVGDKFVYFNLRNFLVDVALALLIAFFFLCDGQAIGVMGIFPAIGGQVLKWFGAKVDKWDYFIARPLPKNFMDADIFVSDLFIIFGAFLASSIKRDFGILKPWPEYIKGIFGGFLMGLGGRMSGGCNIGSMLSGINSCSLHGFVWMGCAIVGSACVIVVDALIEYIKRVR
ncbi:YeeE/YedE family protein [Tritrichomonas foetus]|uniref:YeeE/YedE family protein n=1 Tax=Tritrichomonas foetus TaxID=1144522 RepID=A0A1J4KAM5_9EUKA|nr:YeeE/YedE family protein [Tritrichomonas foetus]|eukprot:OHT06501.1 YeeE/YedE family protein [Tritrichomonas foetus]